MFDEEKMGTVYQPWTEEQIEAFREKEKQIENHKKPYLCAKFGYLEQRHLPENRDVLMEEAIREIPAVVADQKRCQDIMTGKQNTSMDQESRQPIK